MNPFTNKYFMSSNNNNKRLQELGDSKFEIADGQPDIRGWDVRDINGKRLGEVDELIFDAESRKVRYIVLDLEDNEWNLDERDVLIPIGLAELHEKDDDVILRNVSIEQLRALPEYDDDDLDSNLESSIRNIFSGTGASMTGTALSNAASNDTDFYSHEHFNNNLNRNRSSIISTDEHVRMRQEPSFLEREGTNRMDIYDDVDEMREQRIDIEERDAIPVSNSNTLRSGLDIDEWDTTDENTPPRTNTDIRRDRLNNDDSSNRPSSL
jgi:sporulation protein YlmC with PRC-barrel domain